MKKHLLFAFGTLLLSFVVHSTSDAAVVKRVKGQSVLVDLESDSAQEGDTYFLINDEGKKKAIVRITKVKESQAIAKVVKGQAVEGMTLLYRPGKKETQGADSAAYGAQRSRTNFGALAGFSMANMTVKLSTSTAATTNQNQDLTGASFSGHMFFDYALFEKLGFRGTLGVQQFNASGEKVCGSIGNQTCDANILYANMNGMFRFLMSTGDFRPWIGGGFGFLFPLSKSSTALASSSITNTSIGFGAGGFDWFINQTDFIPVSVEYGILPSSTDVSANMISARIGYGTSF